MCKGAGMADLTSDDGRYYVVQHGDGNFVVYDRSTDPWMAVWDKWSYETSQGRHQPPPPLPPPLPDPQRSPVVPGNLPSEVPSGRGPFKQPGNNVRLIRLTTPDDGSVRPIGMAYWPNINNHEGLNEFQVFVSLEDWIHIFRVNKANGTVAGIQKTPYFHTGEACYWDFRDPHLLHLFFPDRLLTYNVMTGAETTVCNVSTIQQPHSSHDGRNHSFTLNGGAAFFYNGRIKTFEPRLGIYDECQIDKSGEYGLVKEANQNRVIHLASEHEVVIPYQEGRVGHSDMGWGYMVGEDDQTDPGGSFRLWKFSPNGVEKMQTVFSTGSWDPMTRYVSHCNAKPGSPGGARLLFSSDVLGLIAFDIDGGSFQVCPSLTDMNARGGENASDPADNYWKKTRANLCPTGKLACFSGNHGSDRMDVFVVELP
jgi:hypothetical protein